MVKTIGVAFCGMISVALFGQVKKQFSVEEKEKCDRIELCIKAKTGNCFIRPSQNAEILNVYSNQELENYAHTLSNEVKNKICMLNLALKQEPKRGIGEKISYSMMGNEMAPSDKFWKIYLTENKPYALDLSYGLGNANVDLSGLSIQKFKIKTASADVNVSYTAGMENKVDMDTFCVKVDMGSVSVKNLHMARSKTVLADVGFGNILLDLSDKPLVRYKVIGSVGAGNLTVLMPSSEVPMLVKVNESWLCSVNLSKSLKKIGENTFANAAYSKNPKDAITFNLDVSMGNITFKEK
jgi:hypothetical protein